MKNKLKVAAALIMRQGKVLIARRKSCGKGSGLWEFPGGTVRKCESIRDALKREIIEELHIAVEPIRYIGRAGKSHISIFFYSCKGDGKRPVLTDHDSIKWVLPVKLPSCKLSAIDMIFVMRRIEEIKRECRRL